MSLIEAMKTNALLGSGEDAKKLDLYERFFRAMAGDSFRDWNPQPIDPNETATFEEAPEKYKITVETRGIRYTVTGDVACAIFPELEIPVDPEKRYEYGLDYALSPVIDYYKKGRVIDFSRFKMINTYNDRAVPCTIKMTYGEDPIVLFLALPEVCAFGKLKYDMIFNENSATESVACSLGLSFGKAVSGMSASSIFYGATHLPDKPVYVMEGFRGDLYLAKWNISVEHMVGIFNNLDDLTVNGGSYTLNFGSHNTDKLTAEQIAIATEKGWNVT